MADKTFDVTDPRDLPYRFTYSPITDEVFVVTFSRGLGVSMIFENLQAFHRFLLEGEETEHKIADICLYQAEEILKAKPIETGG